MHRCLRIPEMVHLVLSHFDIFYFDKVTTAQVYALARTCSTFHFPALDILWKEQRTLLNLLKCVPDDAWVSDEALGLRFVRPLERHDIDRVLFYAPRIKKLHLSYETCNLSEAVRTLCTQAALVDVQFLLPNLALLDSWNWDAETVSRFLRPKLTSLHLRIPDNNFEILKPLHGTPLTSLFFYGTPSNDGSASFSSSMDLVCSLTCLKHLSVGLLDARALKHVGMLPSLQTLNVHLSPDVDIPVDDGDPPRFEHLFRLSLHATAHTASSFLGTVALNSLNEFELNLKGTASTDVEIRAVFAALREHVNHETLTSIRVPFWSNLTAPPHTSPAFPTFVLSAATLDALAPFTELELLDIPAPAGTNLTDADVAALANTFPNLESLAIVTPSHVEWPEENWLRPLTTLQALVSLVDLCPFLVDISLAVDVARGGVPTIHLVNPRSRLQSLNTIYSPILEHQVDLVAQFLAALAPNLTEFATSDEDEASIQNFEALEAQARMDIQQERRAAEDGAQVIDDGSTEEDAQNATNNNDFNGYEDDDWTAASAFEIALVMGLHEWSYLWIRAHRKALRISKALLTPAEHSDEDEDSAEDE
ncbi:hypothetical protein C8F01DRAFT_1370609 [Mycena amicta]|nr:hypothetical protein C8F01DRAFT_1370609 [Mycena amicta]